MYAWVWTVQITVVPALYTCILGTGQYTLTRRIKIKFFSQKQIDCRIYIWEQWNEQVTKKKQAQVVHSITRHCVQNWTKKKTAAADVLRASNVIDRSTSPSNIIHWRLLISPRTLSIIFLFKTIQYNNYFTYLQNTNTVESRLTYTSHNV